jgi:hypothetical protein
VTLPAHSVVPPLPSCLRPVVDYLERHFLYPTHMSSDASFEYAGDKPSSLFSQTSLSVRNATGCVMVADNTFLPKQSPPLLAVLLSGMKRIMNVNSFLAELICGTLLSHLRGHFTGNQILGNMDCGSVLDLQDQQTHLSSEKATTQRRVYGRILQSLLLARGIHPPFCHEFSHPDRFHPATKNRPARPPIPQAQWTTQQWLNHLADRYVSPHPRHTVMMASQKLAPGRIFRIEVEVFLSQVLAPDSLYWARRGMPTVNPIGSFYSPLTRAYEYLRQREAGYEAQSRTEESKYYPKGYWTTCSLAFMKPVLDKLGASRFSDLRANYLLVMWD